ncbi:MAG: Mov34/MPN/PAD-1 family protein [Candidatus Helarchaeota archaeon]
MSETTEIVKIKEKILKKIKNHALRGYQQDSSEVIGYLLGRFKNKSIEIHDIVIPEQKTTNVHAEITDERALVEYLQKNSNQNVHVGWYHSHPNIGCFLSNTDISTQKYWQRVNYRMVAIVIDPVKKDIKAFRLNKKNEVYEIPIKKM